VLGKSCDGPGDANGATTETAGDVPNQLRRQFREASVLDALQRGFGHHLVMKSWWRNVPSRADATDWSPSQRIRRSRQHGADQSRGKGLN